MQKHVHGGDVYSHRDCLDFSANCNPLGTPENVRKAVRDSLDHIKEYPQVGYRPLREAIGQYEDVSPEHIICGNGAAELVFSLCQAVRPKKALIPVPTFAEYEQALSSVGCEVEHVLLKEEDDFAMQETFIDWIHKDLDMVFLCNPNNPTGMLMDQDFLFRVLRVCREQEILLVLDECFLDFVEKGDILRIKSGYYAVHLSDFTEEELVAKLFPDCVLNLENALYAYGYIKKKPYGWRLAVDKNTSKSRFKMDYPKIIPMYAEPDTLELGVTEIQLSNVTVRIFEKERLICECLKYEDKMDRERFKEGLMAYIKDPKKDIAKLMYYAKERKVVKKVQNMIGVWL